MASKSLNLAERLQTLVLVLSDLDLGMNNWMADPFTYPEDAHRSRQSADRRRRSRIRALPATGISTATASATARCPAMSTPCSAYFTRGTGHDDAALYSEKPDVWLENTARLQRKFETARRIVPTPVVDQNDKAEHRHHQPGHDPPRHRGSA